MQLEQFAAAIRRPAPRAAGRSVPPFEYNPVQLGMVPAVLHMPRFIDWLVALARDGVLLSASNIGTSSFADRELWNAPPFSRPLLCQLAREALAAGTVVQADPAYRKLVPVVEEFNGYLRQLGYRVAP